jgi:SPP1 gp7 family putative phage head morphogenesis protein
MTQQRRRHAMTCACCGGAQLSLHAITPRPFNVAPLEAIDFLRDKLRIPTETWTDLWQDMHSAGFMVAGAQSDALLKDFHDAVVKAIANGTTLADFRKEFDRIVEQHGWSYNGSPGWRSKVIFQTNLRMAYAAGRWQQIERVKSARPYLRYVAVMDARTRPLHAAWHNTVLPVDHEWWQTHAPPNGWNCRCTIQSLSARDVERFGLTVAKDAPAIDWVTRVIRGGDGLREVRVPAGIDPGFAYRPGLMPSEAVRQALALRATP